MLNAMSSPGRSTVAAEFFLISVASMLIQGYSPSSLSAAGEPMDSDCMHTRIFQEQLSKKPKMPHSQGSLGTSDMAARRTLCLRSSPRKSYNAVCATTRLGIVSFFPAVSNDGHSLVPHNDGSRFIVDAKLDVVALTQQVAEEAEEVVGLFLLEVGESGAETSGCEPEVFLASGGMLAYLSSALWGASLASDSPRGYS